MKVALIHSYYRMSGGEEAVLATEKLLLEEAGHEVAMFTRSNHDISERGIAAGIRLAMLTVYNWRVKRDLQNFMLREQPDVAHFHNTFPLISPAAYAACRKAGVPVVQTLHNYRLICPAATLSRDGLPCRLCVGRRVAWPAVVHRCYRASLAATMAVTLMLALHKLLRTWTSRVDKYIVLTESARVRFIDGGLPGERLVVKPNCVHPDPGIGSHEGGYALFVGRLSRDKGLPIVLDAWERMGGALPLKVVGPEVADPEQSVARREIDGVDWLGAVEHNELLRLMKNATMLIFASPLHEGMPGVILEAFAVGLCVIAADMSGAKALVDDGRNGILFESGNLQALEIAVNRVRSDESLRANTGLAARVDFTERYAGFHCVEELLNIYKDVAVRPADRR